MGLKHSELLESATTGNIGSQLEVAISYLTGKPDTPRDVRQGMMWLERAAGSGHPTACEDLACFYLLGHWKEYDNGKAKEWMVAAAEAGNINAEIMLKILGFLPSDNDSDASKRFESLLDAAEEGDLAASCRIAISFGSGEGCQRNEKEALAWLKRSASKLHPPSLYYLGQFYLWGVGSNRNVDEGIKALTRASEAGHQLSSHLLEITRPENKTLGTPTNQP